MISDAWCITIDAWCSVFHHDSPWSNAQMTASKCWVENVLGKRTVCSILWKNLKIYLLIVSHLFFARCSYVQVILGHYLLWVVSGCFLLGVGRFLLIVGCFKSFLILVSAVQHLRNCFSSWQHWGSIIPLIL